MSPTQAVLLNPFSSEYQTQQRINAVTAQVAAQNSANKAIYLQDSQDWLTDAVHARDLGQPIPPAPQPPLMLHVDSTGAETSGPDFVANPPVLPASVGTLGSGGLIASKTQVAPDQLDQVLAGLSQLWADIQAIKAKLGIDRSGNQRA